MFGLSSSVDGPNLHTLGTGYTDAKRPKHLINSRIPVAVLTGLCVDPPYCAIVPHVTERIKFAYDVSFHQRAAVAGFPINPLSLDVYTECKENNRRWAAYL